jgi:hypothetical protein
VGKNNARVDQAVGRNRISKGGRVRRAREPIVDPLDRLQSLHAPTAAIHRMNREIAKGRR